MAELKTAIKELRKINGMQQADLAEKVGVRRETIGNLENGKYNPSLKLAMDIARVFGKSVEEVFWFEEENTVLYQLQKIVDTKPSEYIGGFIANYASSEMVRANPDLIQSRAIVILVTRDNQIMVSLVNGFSEKKMIPLDPSCVIVKKSLISKLDSSLVYFVIDDGEYFGRYVIDEIVHTARFDSVMEYRDFLTRL